jgi:hypothetical protein
MKQKKKDLLCVGLGILIPLVLVIAIIIVVIRLHIFNLANIVTGD